jgi:hypothetical protein
MTGRTVPPARLAVLVTLLAILAGCAASGPTIIANRAPGFDLSQYRTFGFYSPLSTDMGTTRSIDSQTLIAATSRELEARGLTRDDDNPDLLVNFLIATKEKIESRPTAGPSMYYGRSRYGTWGGYGVGMGTTTEVVQRTEGTLSVDVVDSERDELVWEGSATGRVTNKVRENRQVLMGSAIREIFLQFP